jgi:hypothetical protein
LLFVVIYIDLDIFHPDAVTMFENAQGEFFDARASITFEEFLNEVRHFENPITVYQ